MNDEQMNQINRIDDELEKAIKAIQVCVARLERMRELEPPNPAPAPVVPYISNWPALFNGRRVERTFVHWSASSDPTLTAEEVRRWHVDGNGWSDIGYHFFIRTDGEIEGGRPLHKTPAAQRGHNTGTIAICINGSPKMPPGQAEFDALRALCTEIAKEFPEMTFHGHNEVSPTQCPGFDYRAVLGLDEFGVMGG